MLELQVDVMNTLIFKNIKQVLRSITIVQNKTLTDTNVSVESAAQLNSSGFHVVMVSTKEGPSSWVV